MTARMLVKAKGLGHKREYLYEVSAMHEIANSAVRDAGFFLARRVVEHSRNGSYRVMSPTLLQFEDVTDVFIVVI